MVILLVLMTISCRLVIAVSLVDTHLHLVCLFRMDVRGGRIDKIRMFLRNGLLGCLPKV